MARQENEWFGKTFKPIGSVPVEQSEDAESKTEIIEILPGHQFRVIEKLGVVAPIVEVIPIDPKELAQPSLNKE